MARLLLPILSILLTLGGCTQVFFQPMRQHVRTPDQIALAYEDVFFDSNDGVRLHAWFLPAKGKAEGTVYFLHGNAENVSTHIGAVHWLPAQGFNVFLLDYRGYGRSQGSPTLPGVLADIDSGFRALLARPDIDRKRVVIFAQSLGGALAIYYTAHSEQRASIRALITESAFAGYRRITEEKLASFWLTWPFQWLPVLTVDDDYSPLPAVAKVSPLPLLLIHGDRDPIVPVEHGHALFAAAVEPKSFWLVEGGGHISAFNREEYRQRFVQYLREVFVRAPS